MDTKLFLPLATIKKILYNKMSEFQRGMNDLKEKKEKGNSAFHKISEIIVDKRNIFFLIYIGLFIFSLISQGWVTVCNDITEYLPEETETRRGLTLMNDEFITYATAKVMVINITYDEAEQLSEEIKELPCVTLLDFDDTEDHYKNGSALLDITLNCEAGDEATAGYESIKNLLTDYDSYMTESDSDTSALLNQEMNIVIIIAAVIIVSVLLFTSQTYMEVPVLLLTFIAAAILNKGTNYLMGEISFVSNSVTAILQLALSIDYAIIMIHHYSEKRQFFDQRDAVVEALAESIPEISASSLTTISGLLALMFMQFRIGFDLGRCLIKSIFFSLLAVFTLMPGLLMLFGKYIDKTPHKNFVPDVSKLGNVVYKLRMVIPPIFVAVLIVGFIFSNKCPYVYDSSSAETDRKNETQISKEEIDKEFGTDNIAAVIIPSGDYDREKQMISEFESCGEVKSVTSLSSVEAMDGYVLTDRLTPRQFAELTDVDVEVCKMLYGLYAADNEDYAKLVGNIDSFGVPLIDMFMFVYDLKSDGYVSFDGDMANSLDDMYVQLDNAKKQLMGEKYSRMLLKLNVPTEGEETFAFLDKAHDIVKKYYSDYYVVGNSTSSYDLASSFAGDNILVSILTVVFVILVLFFTFKSAGLPVLLIAVIQGSVWINFSLPYLENKPMFFLSYLIVSSIQMGANIDYAIVISSRYMDVKTKKPIKEAMCETLNFAFPTVLTSGSILASAGFLIGKLSTEPAVVSIGKTLCSGTLISMFLVMGVLPEILLLGDIIIEKSKFSIKKPQIVRKETGRFLVNGRVRGYINGFVDADIHGIVRGDMTANININNIKSEDEVKQIEESNKEDKNTEEK